MPRAVVGGAKVPELDPLLDIDTKGKGTTALLAIFVFVTFAVLIFLATR